MFGNAGAMSICDIGRRLPVCSRLARPCRAENGEFTVKCVVIRHPLIFYATDNAAVKHYMAVSLGEQNEY